MKQPLIMWIHMIKWFKNDEKMIKRYINQYEYDIDYEFDENSVDDIKMKKIKQEI